MRRFTLMLIFLAALMPIAVITGCAPLPRAPASLANKTLIDEKAALAVELAYQSAALSLKAARDAGLLNPHDLERARAADRAAYAAVMAVRVAYDGGNAASYAEALPAAQLAIAALIKITK